ncbi:faeA-like family protein [Escherichia coli]|mgnify:CR=1 FL=1|uniref:FaeA/PapI family transcriptional regulator n=1 Tax=Escherichia coli TaxID=562 RepID=UPI000CFD3422|nr:FaeA/PapI family transcriptional regulator [Escherichia coli]EJN3746740.1 faeA-like family protein [Escherichia coli]EJN3789958.1 faeA-like family protein [Escherichia coli]HAP0199589.1 faeA-like family protein [Escherichia coli]
MNRDINMRIIDFLEKQKNLSERHFFTTRKIADATGLTIYQARGCLMALQLSRVVEKVNTGRAFPGNGKYIRYRNYSLGGNYTASLLIGY